MNSSKLDNHSKNSAFKKFKRLSYNYFPKFVKTYKNESNFSSNRLDINQFLIIFYDCVPNVSQFLSIDKLLENCNILQVSIKIRLLLYIEPQNLKFFLKKQILYRNKYYSKNHKTSTYF